MDQRRFIYIFSLAYPAVLGSFLFGLISDPFINGERLWAAVLMLFYFLVQYGEGMAAAQSPAATKQPPDDRKDSAYRYGIVRLVQDILEIGALMVVFRSVGLLNSTTGWRHDPLHLDVWWAMAVAFLIPPAFRWLRSRRGDSLSWSDAPSAREQEHGWWLSLLSVLAMFVCLGAAFATLSTRAWSYPALAALTLLLVGYFFFFVWRVTRPTSRS